MKKLSFLPVLTLVLAVGASAFNEEKTTNSDLVWFELNPSTGAPIDPSLGTQGDTPPAAFNCGGTNQYCAKALSISEGEVDDNGDGTYSIAQGVSIQQSFNDHREKN